MSGGVTLDRLEELVRGFREFEKTEGVTITRLQLRLTCGSDDYPTLGFIGETEKGNCALGVTLTD